MTIVVEFTEGHVRKIETRLEVRGQRPDDAAAEAAWRLAAADPLWQADQAGYKQSAAVDRESIAKSE